MAPQEEERVGRIVHYFSRLGVGIVELTEGGLAVGEKIHILGKHTDFTQTVDSMQVEHQNVTRAEKGSKVGIKVKEKVRENDQVFRAAG